jgi:membrane-bound lytic murein transglycosylase B
LTPGYRHKRTLSCAVAGLVSALAILGPARAEQPASAAEAQAFIETLWPAAQARGIARSVFERATAGFVPDPDVAALAAFQPEHTKTVGAYVSALVGEARVASGRQLVAGHAGLLAAIEASYGVDRHVLVAIWGVESSYGREMGQRSVVRSLATLAREDVRRSTFWTRELIAALRILQDGTIAPEKLVGSWAGAMGHTQFIPSTYNARAVDFDKDGRRDIWETVGDALASTANYLRASGWAAGVAWGLEVRLPASFDFAWSTPGRSRPLAEWQAEGVQLVTGPNDATARQRLELLLPAGAKGPAFLITGNYRAILKYNQSMSYALAVGHLADRLAGGGELATPWPTDDKPLSRTEREELQALLSIWGHDTGGRDGIIGDRTRAAIRATQRTLKLAEDGHPSVELLQRLRSNTEP